MFSKNTFLNPYVLLKSIFLIILLFNSFQVLSQRSIYGANISYQVSGNQVKFRVAYYNTTKWEVRASVRILTNAPIYSSDFSRTGQFLNAYYKGSNTLKSIPGATPSQMYVAIYESDYHTIPDSFWRTNNYAFFSAVDAHRVDDRGPGSYRASGDGEYGTPPNFYTNFLQPWRFNYFGIDAIIYPYVDSNGNKTLPKNDSPRFKDFETYGSYKGSESSYINTASDKEGDYLIYRWYHPREYTQNGLPLTHNENAMLRFSDPNEGGIRTSVYRRPCDDPNSPYYTTNPNGGGCNVWVISGTISATYTGDHPLYPIPASGTDNFYLNPFTGAVSFTDQNNINGLRVNNIAVDQYVDGQLVGTVTSELPYFVQEQLSTNQNPLLNITQTTGIHYKTNFQYDVSSLTTTITWRPYHWDTQNNINYPVYKYVDSPSNNGEVLLANINTEESKTVSIVLSYSDPDGDNVTLSHYPIQDNLYNTTTNSFSYGNGTANWSWKAPDAIPVASNVYSKNYRFMFYAQDDGGVINKLNGKTLRALEIIVHKKPTVTISSSKGASGLTNADLTLPITITLGNISNQDVSSFPDALTESDFTVENAVIKDLKRTSSLTFTATLSPTQDALLNPVITKVSLASNTITLSKKIDEEANSIDLSNYASNEFIWTSNRVTPKLSFQIYDSKGSLLEDNKTTNDSYIVVAFTSSENTTNFSETDITKTLSSGFSPATSFTKIDGQNYTYKITPSNNSIGSITFSVEAQKFTNSLGAYSLAGVVSQTGNNNGDTDFTWTVDLNGPTLTISPTTSSNSTGGNHTHDNTDYTSRVESETIFINFDQDTYYKFSGTASLLTALNDSAIEEIQNKINLTITTAYLSDLQADSNNSLRATINYTGSNERVYVNVPAGMFIDQYNNTSSGDAINYKISLLKPYLTSITKKGRYETIPGTIDKRFVRDELIAITSSNSIEVMFGFKGQAQGDAGYLYTRDGRIFDVDQTEIYSSETAQISNFTYYGLDTAKTVDGVVSAEQLFTATLTPISEGIVKVGVPKDVFSNASGNTNLASYISIDYDKTPPTITFVGFDSNGLPLTDNKITHDSFIKIRATASEDIINFQANDISFSYSQRTGTVSNFTTIDSTTFEFDLYPTGGDGQYRPFVNTGRFNDLVGNANIQANNNFRWVYDNTAPKIILIKVFDGRSVLKDEDISSSANVSIEYTFSETVSPVTDLNLVDFLTTHSSSLTFTSAEFNADKTKISAQAVALPGKLTTYIPENYFADVVEQLNESSIVRTWYFDNSLPGVEISVENDGKLLDTNQYFNSGSLQVNYNLTEPVLDRNSNLTLAQLETILRNQVSNGTLSNLQFDPVSKQKFTAQINDFSQGSVSIGFPKSLIFDASGQYNTAAANKVVNFDDIPPTAQFELTNVSNNLVDKTTNEAELSLKITTSESAYDLTLNDLNISNNATITDFQKIGLSNYIVTINNITTGQVTITLSADSFTDVASNTNQDLNQTGYYYDNIRPTAQFSSSEVIHNGTTALQVIPFNLTFSEPVSFVGDGSGVSIIESTLQNGFANGTIKNISWTNSLTLAFEIHRVNNGTVTLTLPQQIFFDDAFNGNIAASDFVFTINGSIALTAVKLSSNNPIEIDCKVERNNDLYVWEYIIPGTRSLLANQQIDNLFAKEGDQITLSISAESAISEVVMQIDGTSYTATQSGTDSMHWFASHTIDKSQGEGKLMIVVDYKDTSPSPVVQTTVQEVTDNVIYFKDFTAPVINAKLFQGDQQVGHDNRALFPYETRIKLYSDDDYLFEKLAFSPINLESIKLINHGGDVSLYEFSTDNLMDLHEIIYHLKNNSNYDITNFQNTSLSADTKVNYTFNIRLYDFHFDINKVPSERVLIPDFMPSKTATITVPNGIFTDLAGNQSVETEINNIKMFGGYSQINFDEFRFERNGCSSEQKLFITIGGMWREDTINSANSDVPLNTDFVLLVSDDNSTYSELNKSQIELKSSSTSLSDSPRSGGAGIVIKELRNQSIYEISLLSSKWVKVRSNNQESTPQFIDFVPPNISLTGSTTICGLGENVQYNALNEDDTIATIGTWSVSNTAIATIDSNGLLTVVSQGNTEVMYTMPEGCVFTKTIKTFTNEIPSISANGETEVCEDSTVTLTTTASENFTWYKDNIPLNNLTATTITLDQTAQSGVYQLMVKTPCGLEQSNQVKVTITEKPMAKINIEIE